MKPRVWFERRALTRTEVISVAMPLAPVQYKYGCTLCDQRFEHVTRRDPRRHGGPTTELCPNCGYLTAYLTDYVAAGGGMALFEPPYTLDQIPPAEFLRGVR